jgi:hypothetical protein
MAIEANAPVQIIQVANGFYVRPPDSSEDHPHA